jgi:hypothetical protein
MRGGQRRRQRRGERGRRCLVEGCGRFVRAGEVVCADHRAAGEGRDAQVALRRLAESVTARAEGGRREADGDEEERARAREGFRRRVERGDYRGLLDARLREVMAQAAEERGLREEIGALRFAMVRLLAEEEDAGKLALGVSRLANASARLARTQRELDQGHEPLNEAISEILRQLDGG